MQQKINLIWLFLILIIAFMINSLIFIHELLVFVPTNLSSTKAGLLSAYDHKVEDLFIGSSHVSSAINPYLLKHSPGILSLAFMNASATKAVLGAHNDLLVRARRVFIEIGGETLLSNSQNTLKSYDNSLFELAVKPDISVKEWIINFPKAFSAFFPRFYATKPLPEAIYYRKEFFAGNQHTLYWRGHSPTKKIFQNKNIKGTLHLVNNRLDMLSFSRLTSNEQVVKSMLHEINHKYTQLKVVLVRYPKHDTFLSYVPAEVEKTYVDFIDKILADQKFKSFVSVLDFQKFGPWQTEYFRDPDHLNSDGAAKVAEIINHQI